MNVLIRSIVSILFTLMSTRAFAAISGDSPESHGHAGVTDRIASVVYRFVEVNYTPVDNKTAEPAANSLAQENSDFRAKIFRVDNRVANAESSNDFLSNDRSSFSMTAPTRTVSNTLSFIGTVSQPLSTTTTKLVQVLSMLSSRKANMQFNYLAPLSKNSRLESTIDCRLNANNGAKVAVTARLQYAMDF
ncbi:MAG: hypothetical protein ABL856_02140 [Gallionella sp.]